MARSQLTTLINITTGHNALAYHVSKMFPDIDSTCSLCGETNETFYHFVTDCPRLRVSRENSNLLEFDTDSWTPECLLDFARIPAIEALLVRNY